VLATNQLNHLLSNYNYSDICTGGMSVKV